MKIPAQDSAILEWIDKNRIVNSRREPFEFDLHAFLLEPMCDWSRKMAIMKSAQVGFTESFGILKSLFAAKYYGLDIIYTNPTSSASDTFVNTKVNRILDNNPVLGRAVSLSKMDLKQIGDRIIYFRGTHSGETQDKKADSDKGISITSDLNIYDERDRSDQFVIDQYESRTENSDYAGSWSFSNPTYPGIGVSKLWDDSDQKHWFVTCSHCGHKQYLDWVKLGEDPIGDHCFVDQEQKEFVCSKCFQVITPTNRMRGEWVAKFPGRDISGYWMSQLNYPKHDVASLLIKEHDRTPNNFYNFVLGKPYRGADMRIDRQVIYGNISRDVNDKKNVAMGVDQGVVKHYVLRNEQGIFAIGDTKRWSDIEDLARKYNATVVMDAQPYPRDAKKLVDKYKSGNGPRFYMAWYREPKDRSSVCEWLSGKRGGEVIINRTMMFDLVVDRFVNGDMPINMPERELGEFTEAWAGMFRAVTEDQYGVPRPIWDTGDKAHDHKAHATIYSEAALMKVTGRGGSTGAFSHKKATIEPKTIESDDNWTSALPNLNELVSDALRKNRALRR